MVKFATELRNTSMLFFRMKKVQFVKIFVFSVVSQNGGEEVGKSKMEKVVIKAFEKIEQSSSQIRASFPSLPGAIAAEEEIEESFGGLSRCTTTFARLRNSIFEII